MISKEKSQQFLNFKFCSKFDHLLISSARSWKADRVGPENIRRALGRNHRWCHMKGIGAYRSPEQHVAKLWIYYLHILNISNNLHLHWKIILPIIWRILVLPAYTEGYHPQPRSLCQLWFQKWSLETLKTRIEYPLSSALSSVLYVVTIGDIAVVLNVILQTLQSALHLEWWNLFFYGALLFIFRTRKV